MKRVVGIIIGMGLMTNAILAQTSFDTLDVNNIHAGFNAAGDMFYNINTGGTYLVTPGNNISYSAANLWIGGYDQNGQLRVSAQTYRQSGTDFWPGPMDTISAYCNPTSSASYNYVWNLTCAEVDSFIAYMQSAASPGYTIPFDIQTWPGNGNQANQSHNLAPYYDADGDGYYNYQAGDYPLIRGSQSLFYVYNDSLQYIPHGESGSASMGLQIKAMPYAYYYPWDEALMNTIFIHYTITNYKTYAFTGTTIGFWSDIDFMNPGPHGVGSDSLMQVAYDYDSTTTHAIYFLSEPMAGFVAYDNNFSVLGNPQSSLDYYELMTQQWSSTESLSYGGTGYNTGNPTHWMYTGNPATNTGWLPAGSSDRRVMAATDTFTLAPGMSKEITVALSFAYDTTPSYASYTKVNQYVNHVRQFYAGNQDYCNLQLSTAQENVQPQVTAYPNPATDMLSVSGAASEISYSIFDINGNLIMTGKTTGESFNIDISSLSSGMYFLQLTSDKEISTTRFVKMQ